MDPSPSPPPADESAEADSLETPDTGTGPLEAVPANADGDAAPPASPAASPSASGRPAASAAPPPPAKKPSAASRLRERVNVYLLLLIFIIILAGGIVAIAYFQNQKDGSTSSLKTTTLDEKSLQQIANSDATVGNNQEVLNVQSSAVFAGKVLIRQDLQVAGNLQIGGTVALNNLTIAGSTQLAQTNISKNLSVSGDTAVQGNATVGKSLQVNGNGSFAGPLSAPQITTSSLQLNGDLTLTHHLVTSGGTPGRSNGSALGSGGSVGVSGDDAAGTVSINTGSSPPAGCFVTVNFTRSYGSTPHILLTPVGSAAGGLAYYVSRTSSSFSICDASSPPAGSSFAFDYFVVD